MNNHKQGFTRNRGLRPFAYVIQPYAALCRQVGGSIETDLPAGPSWVEACKPYIGDNPDTVTHDILEVQEERNGKKKEKYD